MHAEDILAGLGFLVPGLSLGSARKGVIGAMQGLYRVQGVGFRGQGYNG